MTVMILLVLLLIVTFFSGSKIITEELSDNLISNSILTNVDAYSQTLGIWLGERINEVQIYAQYPAIKNMDWDEIQLFLAQQLGQSDAYELLFVADRTGHYYGPTGFLGSVAERPYFPKAMAGESVISNPLISKSTGNEIIVIVAPVFKDDEIVGLVGGTVDLINLFQSIEKYNNIYNKSSSYILDKRGMLVSHTEPKLLSEQETVLGAGIVFKKQASDEMKQFILENKQGTFEYSADHVDYLIYFHQLPNTDSWTLVTEIPKKYSHQLLTSISMKLSVIGLAGLIIGLILSVVIADHITKPIIRLQQVFQRAANGDLTARAETRQQDEIGRAGTSFNIMMENISHMTYYDPLTGLLNFQSFLERLKVEMGYCKQHNKNIYLLIISLDKFRNVNDMYGHSVGDLLLKAIGLKLKDKYGSTAVLARMTGDEFALIATQDQVASVDLLIKKILSDLNRGFSIENNELFVSATIGVAVFPHDGTDEQTLIRNAALAKSLAKKLGGNRANVYRQDVIEQVTEQLLIENLLHTAIERNEFTLNYQPIICLKTGEIVGLEALIRWTNPILGTVAPDKFIKIAEETGLIIPIGEWVLKEACEQNKKWQKIGLKPIPIAVNVSFNQFEQEFFVKNLLKILQQTKLNSKYLELEITERVAMNSVHDQIKKLTELEKLGVKVSIDDFGTGYSSLSYLTKFPIDSLKIDKSFIKDIAYDANSLAIVSTIASMGSTLQINITAEGVETKEQLQILQKLNCHKAQGYLFAKPMEGHQIQRMLEEKTFIALGKWEVNGGATYE